MEGHASLVIGESLYFHHKVILIAILSANCLQLLAKHKYLTGDDVVAVLSHYETVAGVGPRPITTSVADQRPA
jgi:hypothetical protein